MKLKIRDEFRVVLSKRLLIDFFSQDKKRSILAKRFLENYRYTKKYKAGYILLYKYNIYKANMNIINVFYNQFLSFQDQKILSLRYKEQRPFFSIAIELQTDPSVVFNRHRKLLIILASIMLTEIDFDDEFMLSPRILNIMETRVVIESSYAMLGENLSFSNEQIKNRIEAEAYLNFLRKKQEKIIKVRTMVENYLDNLVRKDKKIEYEVLMKAFSDCCIKRDDIGKQLYVSSSRVVQVINKFKKTMQEKCLNLR